MKKERNIFITIVFVMITANALSQQNFRLVSEGSTMNISGTSSLHDWEMNVENFKCEISAIIGNPSITIERASFTGISSSLSSNSSIMDRKAKNALKTEKYPEIKFKLSQPLKIQPKGEVFNGTATGELSIAGKTKTISLPVSGKIVSENSLSINGSKVIDMTEFGIQPPTAMLGTLKTGKEVTISFTINLQPQNGLAKN